jgi:hypothetical protein
VRPHSVSLRARAPLPVTDSRERGWDPGGEITLIEHHLVATDHCGDGVEGVDSHSATPSHSAGPFDEPPSPPLPSVQRSSVRRREGRRQPCREGVGKPRSGQAASGSSAVTIARFRDLTECSLASNGFAARCPSPGRAVALRTAESLAPERGEWAQKCPFTREYEVEASGLFANPKKYGPVQAFLDLATVLLCPDESDPKELATQSRPRVRIRLSEEQLNDLAESYKSGVTMKELAERYSIQRQTVSVRLKRMGVPVPYRLVKSKRGVIA